MELKSIRLEIPEGGNKFHLRDRVDDSFVDVLYRLDNEVRLPSDEEAIRRLVRTYPAFYSSLRALTGSTEAARRAGTQQAKKLMQATTSAAVE